MPAVAEEVESEYGEENGLAGEKGEVGEVKDVLAAWGEHDKLSTR
jgi:hypothetical protein